MCVVDIMEYTILIIAAFLLILSLSYRKKHQKLVPTGRIPDAIAANRRSALSFVLAIFTIMIFIAVKQYK